MAKSTDQSPLVKILFCTMIALAIYLAEAFVLKHYWRPYLKAKYNYGWTGKNYSN